MNSGDCTYVWQARHWSSARRCRRPDAGGVRPHQTRAGAFRGAASAATGSRDGSFIDWVNGPPREEPALIPAALGHLWFVTLHPFDDGKLTSSKWAAIAKCSPDTALRDISDLLACGVLRKTGGGGRSTGYELEELSG